MPERNVPGSRQVAQAHRAAHMQFTGRDAHFGTETELTTVMETRRAVDEDRGRIECIDKTLRQRVVVRDNRF